MGPTRPASPPQLAKEKCAKGGKGSGKDAMGTSKGSKGNGKDGRDQGKIVATPLRPSHLPNSKSWFRQEKTTQTFGRISKKHRPSWRRMSSRSSSAIFPLEAIRDSPDRARSSDSKACPRSPEVGGANLMNSEPATHMSCVRCEV